VKVCPVASQNMSWEGVSLPRRATGQAAQAGADRGHSPKGVTAPVRNELELHQPGEQQRQQS
jgi:hypothetical protein